MEKRKNVNVAIIVVISLSMFLFQLFASIMGGKLASKFDYINIDKYDIFAWISVHHIGQLLLALLVILMLSKWKKLDFRFRVGNARTGLKITAIFSLILLTYYIILYMIGYAINLFHPYAYPLTATNISGYLGFQLILSGTEEILFRALPITILASLLGNKSKIKLFQLNLPIDVIIAAILFVIAHIDWSTNPFTLYFDWFQLIYAFILGLCYGITYLKSDSIIYPMLMHSISNVLSIGIGYLFALCQ